MNTKQYVHKSKCSGCCYFCSSDSRNTGVTFGQRLIVDWCESEVVLVGFLCWLYSFCFVKIVKCKFFIDFKL